jgi:hypothetical protein
VPQRQFAGALGIDTLMFGEIECDRRPAKRKHIAVMVHLLKTDKNMLVTLRLADKIIAAIGEEKKLSNEVLYITKKH